VICIDNPPFHEGRSMLQLLTSHGIQCIYTLLNTAPRFMKIASKVNPENIHKNNVIDLCRDFFCADKWINCIASRDWTSLMHCFHLPCPVYSILWNLQVIRKKLIRRIINQWTQFSRSFSIIHTGHREPI